MNTQRIDLEEGDILLVTVGVSRPELSPEHPIEHPEGKWDRRELLRKLAEAREELQPRIDEIKEKLAEAIEAAQGALKQKLEALRARAEEIAQAIRDRLSELSEEELEDLKQEIIAKVDNVRRRIEEAIREAQGVVKEKLEELLSALEDLRHDLRQKLEEYRASLSPEHPIGGIDKEAIKAKLQQVVDDVRHRWENRPETGPCREAIAAVLSDLRDKIANINIGPIAVHPIVRPRPGRPTPR